MRKSVTILTIMLVCALATNAVAQLTLFSEDWNSGAINPADWNVNGPTANVFGVELPANSAPGDMALAMRGTQDPDFPGTASTWTDSIMSVLDFDRNQQVTVEFKAWHKQGSNVQVGVHGGFHHLNVAGSQQIFGNDLGNTPEATFGHFVNDIRAYESGDGFQAIGTAVSFAGATLSLTGANTKNGASTFKVTLDPTAGAKWEIDVPAANANANMICGGPGPCSIVGRDTLGSGTSNNALNNVGFGVGGAGLAGTVYIDDVIVSAIPEPSSLLLLVGGALALVGVRRRS